MRKASQIVALAAVAAAGLGFVPKHAAAQSHWFYGN